MVDTNCLLVSIPRHSATRWLYDSIKSGAVEIGISNEILVEYEEIIGDFYSPSLAGNVIELLINLKDSHRLTPYYRWNLISKTMTIINLLIAPLLARLTISSRTTNILMS